MECLFFLKVQLFFCLRLFAPEFFDGAGVQDKSFPCQTFLHIFWLLLQLPRFCLPKASGVFYPASMLIAQSNPLHIFLMLLHQFWVCNKSHLCARLLIVLLNFYILAHFSLVKSNGFFCCLCLAFCRLIFQTQYRPRI